MKLLGRSIVTAVSLMLLVASAPTVSAQQSPADRVAAIKQWLARSKEQLRGYQWTQTTVLTSKGEVKSTAVDSCYYDATGTLQKVPVSATPVPEGLADTMKKAVALVKSYVPPNPLKLQARKDAGKVSLDAAAGGGSIRLNFHDYELPGDSLSVTLDPTTNKPTGFGVATYLDDPKDRVTVAVTIGSLPDGTEYPNVATLDALAHALKVTATNSEYRKAGSAPAPKSTPVMTRAGECDASGAVAVAALTFVVGSDEDNILRVYGPDDVQPQPGALELSSFLGIATAGLEADIEGATRIGDVVYWITSHGADGKGRPRPSGRRLFATKVSVVSGKAQLTPVGVPYESLVEDFIADPRLAPYGLEAASKRAPKTPNALNIEGLTATPSGGLLIGFRNPIPQGKALVVPIENPSEVVMGKARAKLGPPILLALSGLGIRSFEYSAARGEYLIVAGPDGVVGPFKLYRWSGSPNDQPIEVPGVPFTGLQPEALIVYPDDPNTIEILSDDGTRDISGVACKDLPVDRRVFRSFRVSF